MFQRRMFLVASQLRNAQLSPKLFRRRKRTQQQESQEDDNEDDFDNDVGRSQRSTIDDRLQSIVRLNKKKYRKKLSLSEGAAKGQQFAEDATTKTYSIFSSIYKCIKKYRMSTSFVLYIGLGTLFYSLDHNNRQSAILGFYQAITIGYSVGLGPKDPNYEPNPWFSSFYILVGAALIAIILTDIGGKVEESSSLHMFEALQSREDYEHKMERGQPICTRVKAFVQYYKAYLFVIFLWLGWLAFIIIWSMASVSPHWGFAEAQYFAFSLSSSAGSLSLPNTAPEWAYLLAGISMLIGVPLMAMAVSAIVVMLTQGHNYRKIKRAAWDPVLVEELKVLSALEIGALEGGQITKGGYIMLGLLRMGQDGGVIKYLADAYDESESRGGVLTELQTGTGSRRNTKLDGLSGMAAAYVAETNSDDGDSNEFALESSTSSIRATRATKMTRSWSTAGSAEGSFRSDHVMNRFISDSSADGLQRMESINEGDIMGKKNDSLPNEGVDNDAELGMSAAGLLETAAGVSK